ncbi:dynein heavy chain 5, axonemal, partial [Eurytemora carolleeae]|uniref:dynein heavy chain 5, axonemal n=1 Tax=Eurytemora carolleeae TaxID=1294199 RepID=UPI000C763711
MNEDELQKKREEAERKARRGEIDPTHEFTFLLIGQFSGLLRHEIMDYMFNDPSMLDHLDYLFKSDNARKLLFYYQGEEPKDEEKGMDQSKNKKRIKNPNFSVLEKGKEAEERKPGRKILFVTDGSEGSLNGFCMYFLRTSTKRTLGEETFQREIMAGLINANINENLLWNIERSVSNVFIPLLNTNGMGDKGTDQLLFKVKKELLPCLRSFTSSLRVAELVWKEGVLIKEFPPESYTIKNIDDAFAYLKTEDGQKRFEEYLRSWMKKIQELLLESEQLRLETDDAGPQDELEYWKSRAARLTLLVEQINTMPCRMTLVVLRTAQCKLMKAWREIDVRITRYHVEACDNAKFLGAIERSSHAIYLEDPYNMKTPLMRLLHIVKMIFNVSCFYNTPERVASLLVKITNQVIRSCKRYITESGRVTIWNQEREQIEIKLTECIKLNDHYRDAYQKVKNRKVGRELREFSFSEKYIFGRFDSFCIRLKNLL